MNYASYLNGVCNQTVNDEKWKRWHDQLPRALYTALPAEQGERAQGAHALVNRLGDAQCSWGIVSPNEFR